MHDTSFQRSSGWALTDVDGRVELLSRDVQRYCGGRQITRGHDLLALFPDHEKAVRFDMTAARMGWPAVRTVVIDAMSARPVAVRYWISPRIKSSVDAAAGLYWRIEFREIGGDSDR